MPISKQKATSATAAPAAKKDDALEKKVAVLEALVEKLSKDLVAQNEKCAKSLADLDAKCEAKPATEAAPAPAAKVDSALKSKVDAMWKHCRKDRVFRELNK